MALRIHRPARVNVRLLIIIVLVVAALGISAVVARQVRRKMLANREHAAALAAIERNDWQAARTHLREYLSRRPEDFEMLEKYGQVEMSVRPLEVRNVSFAIWAYRGLLRGDPRSSTAYEKLVILYSNMRNFDELGYIAQKRHELVKDDPSAVVWWAKALIGQRKPEKAREKLLALIRVLDQRKDQKKYGEHVEASLLLAAIAANEKTEQGDTEAIKHLNLAVQYDPESAEALATRAQFYRIRAFGRAQDQQDVMLVAARADLEQADMLKPTDPRIRFVLASEWLAHSELDRAAAEFEAIKDMDETSLEEFYLDPNDFVVARFLLGANLSGRTSSVRDGIALTDNVLATVTRKTHRFRVLPGAVSMYLAGRKIVQARSCLDEYLDLLRLMDPKPVSDIDMAILQAMVAGAEDNLYRIIDLLEPMVTRNVTRSVAWELLARAYSRTDQSRRAIRAMVKYLRLRPRAKGMMLRLAREYIKQRSWGRALETARLAEPLDPADFLVKLLRIEASAFFTFESEARGTEARLQALSEELIELRKLHPDRVEIRILQAIIQINQGRADDAEKELKLAIEECSETLRAELQLVSLYFRQKRTAEAIEVCRQACKNHKKVASAWKTLCDLLLVSKQFEEARRVLQAGLDGIDDRWERRDLTIKLALFEILHGERSSGLTILKDMAEQDKFEIRARSVLLRMPEILQDLPVAQKLIDEIREIQGESGLLWRLYQASLWLAGKDWRSKQQEIVGALTRCIESDPDWPSPVLLLGGMYRKLGQQDFEEQVYRRSLRVNPASTSVADCLVGLLEKHHKYPEAQDVLDKLQAGPRALWSRRFRVALGRGQFDQAISELELRIADNEKDAASRILLARLVYWQLKDVGRAFKLLDEARTIEPETMSVTAARVAILRAEKRLPEARKLLDAEVNRTNSFAAYLLRGAFLANIEESDLAEKDFIHLTTFEENQQGYELLGRFYAKSDRIDDAIAAWTKGVDAYPQDTSIKSRLVKALLVRSGPGDSKQAIAMLNELEKALPDHPDLMRTRALVLLGANSPQAYEQARKLLERAIKLEPTFLNAYLDLIALHMRAGDFGAARDLAVRAQGANPKSIKPRLARAQAEVALNNFPIATGIARMILKEVPDNIEACEILIEIALKTRKHDALEEAQSAIDVVMKNRAGSERLRWANSLLLNALGQKDEAIASLEGFCRTEMGKKDLMALLTLAEFHRLSGHPGECEQWIDRAEQLAPKSPAVLNQRILLLGARNDFDQVVALVSAYRKQESNDPAVCRIAGSVLAASKSADHRKEAIVLFEHVIAVAPQMIDAHLGLALLVYQQGQVDRAEKIYRNVLKSNPRHPQVLNDLAWILAKERQQYEEALKLADRGVKLAPKNHHLRDTRGVILFHLPGRIEDAREDFEEYLKLTVPGSPTRAKAFLQLARVDAKLKNWDDSAQHLREALKIDRQHNVFDEKEQAEIDQLLKKASKTGT